MIEFNHRNNPIEITGMRKIEKFVYYEMDTKTYSVTKTLVNIKLPFDIRINISRTIKTKDRNKAYDIVFTSGQS